MGKSLTLFAHPAFRTTGHHEQFTASSKISNLQIEVELPISHSVCMEIAAGTR
jgi:hypothetical protein